MNFQLLFSISVKNIYNWDFNNNESVVHFGLARTFKNIQDVALYLRRLFLKKSQKITSVGEDVERL